RARCRKINRLTQANTWPRGLARPEAPGSAPHHIVGSKLKTSLQLQNATSGCSSTRGCRHPRVPRPASRLFRTRRSGPHPSSSSSDRDDVGHHPAHSSTSIVV
ncbi:unnamed protein product, partial [Musa textilis]